MRARDDGERQASACNGLDLEWMAGLQEGARRRFSCACRSCSRGCSSWAFRRVAALQGHAFAAGAMLALAHDERVMRADRGFFCLPEVDIGLPFTPGMNALITARLSQRTAHEAMTTGRRYGGEEAARAGIVEEAVPRGARCCRSALARAQDLAGKNPDTLRAIKQRLYEDALAALRGPLQPEELAHA